MGFLYGIFRAFITLLQNSARLLIEIMFQNRSVLRPIFSSICSIERTSFN